MQIKSTQYAYKIFFLFPLNVRTDTVKAADLQSNPSKVVYSTMLQYRNKVHTVSHTNRHKPGFLLRLFRLTDGKTIG